MLSLAYISIFQNSLTKIIEVVSFKRGSKHLVPDITFPIKNHMKEELQRCVVKK